MAESKVSDKSLTVPTNPARALRDLNRAAAPAPSPLPQIDHAAEVDNPTNNTTILQSDKPTNRPTNKPADKLTNKQTIRPTDTPTDQLTDKQSDSKQSESPTRARVDGRTNRPRQETADRTMVTSMRLAVSTLEALDEHCYRHRQRKQDVVQAALDMYFAAVEAEE